jgi:hypothetical protein
MIDCAELPSTSVLFLASLIVEYHHPYRMKELDIQPTGFKADEKRLVFHTFS